MRARTCFHLNSTRSASSSWRGPRTGPTPGPFPLPPVWRRCPNLVFVVSRLSFQMCLGARRLACPRCLWFGALPAFAWVLQGSSSTGGRVRLNGAGCSPSRFLGPYARRGDPPTELNLRQELAFQALSRPPCVPVPADAASAAPSLLRGTATGPKKQPKAAEGLAPRRRRASLVV